MKTEHRSIPGYPAYRVYPDGVIESKWRIGMFYDGFRTKDRWRRLKLYQHEKGYLSFNLRDGHGGGRRAYAHILVAELFIGPKPYPNACVRHLNGNAADNGVANLAWGTYKENEDDKIEHGTWNTRNGGAKISPAQVRAIREKLRLGESQKRLAESYGVSRPTITRIANFTIWKHI